MQHPALIGYLKSRVLEVKDVAVVSMEVHWTNGEDNFFAIGFQNSRKGYAVRSMVYKGNLNGGGISTFTIEVIHRVLSYSRGLWILLVIGTCFLMKAIMQFCLMEPEILLKCYVKNLMQSQRTKAFQYICTLIIDVTE